MKFAIFYPRLRRTNGGGVYVKTAFDYVSNWEEAQLFFTREDAQAYLDWLKKNAEYIGDDLIIRQVE